MKGPKFMRMF